MMNGQYLYEVRLMDPEGKGYLPGTGDVPPDQAVNLGESATLEEVAVVRMGPGDGSILTYEYSYTMGWFEIVEDKSGSVSLDSSEQEFEGKRVKDTMKCGKLTVTCSSGADVPIRGHIAVRYSQNGD